MLDEIRAEAVKPGDIITSVYNPDAVKRQPAGWRTGDPASHGRFVDVLPNGAEFKVTDKRESDVHGIVVSNGHRDLTLTPDTLVEVIR